MSEIVFSDVKKLKTVVDKLFLTQEGDALSPHKCLKINQVNPNTTEFTVYSPRKLKFSYRYSDDKEGNGGEQGTEFIVDHEGLKTEIDNFNSAKRNKLTFNTMKGRLVIKANETYDEEGNSDFEAVSYCNLYTGTSEDFDPPDSLLEEQYIGSIDKDHLLQIFKSVDKFGGSDVNSDGVFYLRLENRYAVAATNSGLSSSGYTFLARPLQEDNLKDVVATSIYRSQIHKLNFIISKCFDNEQVKLFYEYTKNWIEFSCSAGNLVVKGVEANQQIVNALLVTAVQDQIHHSSRIFNCKELISTLEQFRNSKTNKLVLWAGQDGSSPIVRCNELDHWSEYKYAKIQSEFVSNADYWVACSIEGTMLCSLINTLRLIRNDIESKKDIKSDPTVHDVITIKQYKKDTNPRIVLLYVFIDYDSYRETCFGLLYGSDLSHQIDQVDSDE